MQEDRPKPRGRNICSVRTIGRCRAGSMTVQWMDNDASERDAFGVGVGQQAADQATLLTLARERQKANQAGRLVPRKTPYETTGPSTSPGSAPSSRSRCRSPCEGCDSRCAIARRCQRQHLRRASAWTTGTAADRLDVHSDRRPRIERSITYNRMSRSRPGALRHSQHSSAAVQQREGGRAELLEEPQQTVRSRRAPDLIPGMRARDCSTAWRTRVPPVSRNKQCHRRPPAPWLATNTTLCRVERAQVIGSTERSARVGSDHHALLPKTSGARPQYNCRRDAGATMSAIDTESATPLSVLDTARAGPSGSVRRERRRRPKSAANRGVIADATRGRATIRRPVKRKHCLRATAADDQCAIVVVM